MSDKEAKNIQSWTQTAANQRWDEIASESIDPNDRNRKWWETMPMTYVDWDSSEREPATLEDFANVDRHYFKTNPYIDEKVDFTEFKDKRVLEIGCGSGSAACRFAESGAQVSAVDLTEKATLLTRRHAELRGLTLDVHQDDAETLSSISDGSIDFLYSWGVMHHSSKPEQCFAQACRTLVPGGHGLIMVYHRSSIRFWLKGLIYLFLKGRIFKGDSIETVQRHYTDGYYHKHYTRSSLTRAMQQAGFHVDGIDVTHMSSRMVPFVPEPVRQWLKRRNGWLLVARVSKP